MSCTAILLTFVLELLGLFGREGQPVDVVVEEGGPRLELVHDVPRGRHGHAQQQGCVPEVGLFESEPEQVRVGHVPVKDPVAKPGLVCNNNKTTFYYTFHQNSSN